MFVSFPFVKLSRYFSISAGLTELLIFPFSSRIFFVSLISLSFSFWFNEFNVFLTLSTYIQGHPPFSKSSKYTFNEDGEFPSIKKQKGGNFPPFYCYFFYLTFHKHAHLYILPIEHGTDHLQGFYQRRFNFFQILLLHNL